MATPEHSSFVSKLAGFLDVYATVDAETGLYWTNLDFDFACLS